MAPLGPHRAPRPPLVLDGSQLDPVLAARGKIEGGFEGEDDLDGAPVETPHTGTEAHELDEVGYPLRPSCTDQSEMKELGH